MNKLQKILTAGTFALAGLMASSGYSQDRVIYTRPIPDNQAILVEDSANRKVYMTYGYMRENNIQTNIVQDPKPVESERRKMMNVSPIQRQPMPYDNSPVNFLPQGNNPIFPLLPNNPYQRPFQTLPDQLPPVQYSPYEQSRPSQPLSPSQPRVEYRQIPLNPNYPNQYPNQFQNPPMQRLPENYNVQINVYDQRTINNQRIIYAPEVHNRNIQIRGKNNRAVVQ